MSSVARSMRRKVRRHIERTAVSTLEAFRILPLSNRLKLCRLILWGIVQGQPQTHCGPRNERLCAAACLTVIALAIWGLACTVILFI